MSHVLPLISRADKEAAKELVMSESLQFESDYDDAVGLFDQGCLIACGARLGRVLKMLVVSEAYRGGSILGEIITALMSRDTSVRSNGYYIFTKPCAIASFKRLNFRCLVEHKRAGLLENRNGLNRFLRRLGDKVINGNNAAVTISSDPFTCGHLHLIEVAARESDNVYVFIPAEGDFHYSIETRMALAEAGTREFDNVFVINAESYVLTEAVFPGYFLPASVDKKQLMLEMDLKIFTEFIAPYFSIKKRYIGDEPLDPALRKHNPYLKFNLSQARIGLIEVSREKSGDLWINTNQVKRVLAEGGPKAVRSMVPESTYSYLENIFT